MESSNGEGSGTATLNTYRLSWIAYIPAIFVLFLLLALSAGMGMIQIPGTSTAIGQYVGMATIAVALSLFLYQTLYLRSTVVFTNDSGVWLFRGVFPWEKGVVGVRWRDMDEAIVMTGFFSWVFNAYTIRVNHRFTGNSELTLKNLNNGRKAVAHMNKMHREKTQGSSQ